MDIRLLRRPVLVGVKVQKFRTHPRITSTGDEGHQGIPLVRSREGRIQVNVHTNDGGEAKVCETSAAILVY